MDRRKPTVQMLGRYQPWHDGHRELFKRAHAKTSQVAILVRDTGKELKSKIMFNHVPVTLPQLETKTIDGKRFYITPEGLFPLLQLFFLLVIRGGWWSGEKKLAMMLQIM